jgi:hypothetical protein
MTSKKIKEGKHYSLMLGKFGTYFIHEPENSLNPEMTNEAIFNCLNNYFSELSTLNKENIELKTDIINLKTKDNDFNAKLYEKNGAINIELKNSDVLVTIAQNPFPELYTYLVYLLDKTNNLLIVNGEPSTISVNELVEENNRLKADIEKYMNALDNNSQNTKTLVNANKFFVTENVKLLRKYKYQVPFPDCTQKSMGICKNGINLSSKNKNYCENTCKNRKISKLKESGKIISKN